jgi:FkbM family methyltransferase
MSKALKNIVRAVKDPRQALAVMCRKYLRSYNNYSYDFHKNGEHDLLLKLSQIHPKVILDVGANVGDWALIAKETFPEATIHCFELSSRTFQTLSRNVTGSRCVLNNFGLSDKAGEFEYKDYGPDSVVNTLLLDATFHDMRITPQLVKARISTGAAYCQTQGIEHIDFLKIDVEGAEHLVLQGFAELIERKAVRIIQFEYGYTNGDAKFLMRDFFRFFNDKGYVVGRVNKGPIVFRDWIYKDNDFTSGPNYVAIRQDDVELLQLLSR